MSPVSTGGRSCNARLVDDDPKKIICVCSEDSCDQLGGLNWPHEPGEVWVYTSNRAGKRFDLDKDPSANKKDFSSSATINVDLSKKYQTIIGWGGAFTDAFGINVRSLSEEMQDNLIEAYFGQDGLRYNFGRVPIGGSDFSPRAYTYDDSLEPDYQLKNFSLTDEDNKYKIPLILSAMKTSGIHLNFFASPWSPPAWMKQNKKLIRGHLTDDDRIYKAYAEYLIKFFQEYKKAGIKFWGATVQNEPSASNMPLYFFNSLQMDSRETIKFVKEYLGPALEAEGYTKENFKLMVGDDSLGFVDKYATEVLQDPGVQKYVSGFAYHWYTSGTMASYDRLNELHEIIKDKVEFTLMSEACEGSMPIQKKVDMGSWARAESYASDIIEDLNRHTNGWIDWNMALDMDGGPNWSKNFVDSPILVNSERNEFYKQPMYYALGHFSRFLLPGLAVRLGSTMGKRSLFSSSPLATAFHDNQTNHVVVNVLNKSDSNKRIKINLLGAGEQSRNDIEVVADKRSIITVLIKL